MNSYAEFLEQKKISVCPAGFTTDTPDFLYPFQKVAVDRALKLGRSAMFQDCGLGKTPQQLVWADKVHQHTNKPTLILAPLAVAEQTQREGNKFSIPVNICRSQKDVINGINIANYEMLHHFDSDAFGSLVLDESSILKNFSGKYRQDITAFGKRIPYRLACTATPAPNDLIEIVNHAEFLSVLSVKEIIALFFKQDGNTTHAWRLKGHAESAFWSWMTNWALAVRKPSDLGFDDGKFTLPKLEMFQHIVDGHIEGGWLFPIEAQTLQEQRTARRESLSNRVAMCASLVNGNTEPWLVWCDLNTESEALHRAIPGSVEVKGSDTIEHKIDALTGFSEGRYRVLVTKPSIAGFGMNWQHCARMAFIGLSHSWEALYQAIRRCWRYGQLRPVHVHLVIAETEGAVLQNVLRKERNANEMMEKIIAHMNKSYVHFKDDARFNGITNATIPKWIGACHGN